MSRDYLKFREIPEARHSRPNDIRRFLNKLLQSGIFRSRGKPSEVLSFLVDQALHGKTVTEKDLQAQLFAPPYNQQATNVRTNINILRKLLQKYYDGEGLLDEIVIRMPKRDKRSDDPNEAADGYRILFSQRVFVHDEARLLINRSIMHRWTPRSIWEAGLHYANILKSEPFLLEANLGFIESQCLLAAFVSAQLPKRPRILAGIDMGKRLADSFPANPEVHLTLGFAYLCGGFTHESSDSLGEALRMLPPLPLNILWLPFLLLFLGGRDEARSYMVRIQAARLPEAKVSVAAGFLHYLLHDFQQAKIDFEYAKYLDASLWMPRLGLSMVHLSTNNPEEALQAHIDACKVMGDDIPPMPGVRLLAERRSLNTFESFQDDLQANDGPAKDPACRDYFQIAISNIDSDPDQSVAALRLAIHYKQPLALTIPFFPLFEPLREKPDFQMLSDKVRFLFISQPEP